MNLIVNSFSRFHTAKETTNNLGAKSEFIIQSVAKSKQKDGNKEINCSLHQQCSKIVIIQKSAGHPQKDETQIYEVLKKKKKKR